MSHFSRGTPITLMHVGVFFVAAAILFLVLFCRYNALIAKQYDMTVDTTAKLVKFVEQEDKEQGTKYVPEFRYVVNGFEYFTKSQYGVSEKLYKGQGVGYIEQIKYNPQNPEESIIVGEEAEPGTIFLLIFLGALALGILCIVIYIKKMMPFFKAYNNIGKDSWWFA